MVSLVTGEALTASQRRELAFEAAQRASRLRSKMGIEPQAPAPILDVIDELDIELRFMPIPSLEGMYSSQPNPIILISSERPPGRQAYTAAHELGHHVYGHGVVLDETNEETGQEPPAPAGPEEYLADRFASYFLMPKIAVKHGFRARGWQPEKCTAHQVYTVAGWLGVGYTTLVHHMRAGLKMLPYERYAGLLKWTPKGIRADILGREVSQNLLIVGPKWEGRAVDIRVGDLVMLPAGTAYEGNVVSVEETGTFILLASTAPGIGRVYSPDTAWAAFVRSSRRGYVGLSKYRHLEDPDYEVEDG